uniref:DED domain-containing protein n=1 Tax=Branchiostoma floridae TaxID=7739 RepID=C3ZU69_BRAFL|eukprot:XP_002587944.1 hypothetical protein BRAFLDRAFT_87332 [Branchiostoma floridae]
MTMMPGPIRERVTAADRRHFDFVQTLRRISDELTEEETADVKLFCGHLIPRGQAEQLRRAVDVFQKLIHLDKIDQKNLDFLEEILERIGRLDLIRDVLRRFQPPDREIPENPELQQHDREIPENAEFQPPDREIPENLELQPPDREIPENPELQPPDREDPQNPEFQPPDREIPENPEFQPPDREIPENPELQPENPELRPENQDPQPSQSNTEGANEEGNATSNIYVVVHGRIRMIQETLDHLKIAWRHYLALEGHRLVYMGVKSLQIDAEVPIKVQQGAPLYDVKRQLPVDDIEVGCSTRNKRQRAPQSWTRLSALNLFSDALPLHLQAAASLEYQGFSYSLVRALVQKDRLREQQMRQAIQNLRNAEVDSNTLRQKPEVDSNTLRQNAEVDSNTLRQKAEVDSNTLRQKAEVDSNTLRQKAEVESNTLRQKAEVDSNTLRQKAEVDSNTLRQKAEVDSNTLRQKAEVDSNTLRQKAEEYRGEKPPGGWSAHVERANKATQAHLADIVGTAVGPGDVGGNKLGEDPTVKEEDKRDAGQDSDTDNGSDGREKVIDIETPEQERHTAETEGAAAGSTGDRKQDVITFGGKGTEPGKFYYPRGVVVSPSNEIFVTDGGNRRVQVHSTEGVYLRHFPTVLPGTEDKDMEPHDVCMDGNGTLWVVGRAGTAEHVVQYSTDGTVMSGFDLKKDSYDRGIAVNMRTNHILVTDADQRAVLVFRPDGSLVRTVRHPRAGEMTHPQYVTVDGEGNILVSDWDTNCVYVYDESGKFLFQFGGEGRGEGQLKWPLGICTDSSGHILVADSGNERVQIFTRHGEFVRTFRTGPGSYPESLTVGPEGQLVVTNDRNHTVTIYPNY